MMKYQKGFINERDFNWFMVLLVVFGIFIGALLFVGLPALWSVLKPFIHAWTA